MSLIYGILNFKDLDVVAKLKIIQKGCCPEFYDKEGSWINDNIGLGNILRLNTPESVYENMPAQYRNFIISAYARIDNREELFKILSIPINDQSNIPDSLLIVKAYEKWGDNCVNYLDGDWVFAIWDINKKKLIIARDHFGSTGLVYYYSERLFAFCSSLKGLLALNEIPKKINEEMIGGILADIHPGNGQTPYLEINHLPPGQYLIIQKKEIKICRYYYPENIKQLNYNNLDDYQNHFLELYKNAVKARLRAYGSIGSMLSGGLDSGSVSALAARELKVTGKTLSAFTSVPSFKTVNYNEQTHFADESVYAKATAHFAGNILLTLINGNRYSVLESIKYWLSIQNFPNRSPGNEHWLLDLFKTAQEAGIKTLLIGQHGNITISWRGIPEKQKIKTIINYIREPEVNYLWLIKNIVNYFIPSIRELRQYSKEKIFYHFKWREYSPINKQFADKIKVSRLLSESIYNEFIIAKQDPLYQRCYLMEYLNNTTYLLYQQQGFEFNLHITDPTNDKKLMNFCFSVPNSVYRRNNEDGYLIRSAMQNILPDEVRLNRRRGLQGADTPFRARLDYVELKKTLQILERSDIVNYYLDLKKMYKVLEKKNLHYDDLFSTDRILNRGIQVGLFLKRFEE